MMNHKNILCALLIGFLHINNGNAQRIDTSKVITTFSSESQLFKQTITKRYGEVHSDNTSNMSGEIIKPFFENVTDEPLNHAAFYTLICSKTELYKRYSIGLDLLFEHRGISYGIYSVENTVIYPYFEFGLQEEISIFNKTFQLKADLGSYRNSKIHQGLKVYNIDFHGFNVSISWKKLFFKVSQIGDLCNGIGLAIDELFDYSVGYNHGKADKKSEFGINLSNHFYGTTAVDDFTNYNKLGLNENSHGNFKYKNVGFWFAQNFRENFKVYVQYELRAKTYNLQDNSAILLGGQVELIYSSFQISFNTEFRYYGWIYNYGHMNNSVNYRNNPQNVFGHYANTVGKNLYPLMNFNNHFSQWAVYTEYQYQNIAGFEFRTSFNKQLHRRFYIEGDFESCTFLKEYSDKPFTYIFYSSHLVYGVRDFLKLGAGINNKTMNLDKHYQTFYMRNKPVFDLYITCKFGKM